MISKFKRNEFTHSVIAFNAVAMFLRLDVRGSLTSFPMLFNEQNSTKIRKRLEWVNYWTTSENFPECVNKFVDKRVMIHDEPR